MPAITYFVLCNSQESPIRSTISSLHRQGIWDSEKITGIRERLFKVKLLTEMGRKKKHEQQQKSSPWVIILKTENKNDKKFCYI